MESVFSDSCSDAPALLTEPEHAEGILGFGSIGPGLLLSQYRVKWVTNWLGLCIYSLVVRRDLPATDKLTRS